MTTSVTALRKRPQQARSLARFNHILDEAEHMIAEQGDSDLKMNELARRAGVNIASIYQYFPNRPALLRQLIERYLTQYQSLMQQGLQQYAGDALGVVDLIVDGFYGFFKKFPVFSALWAEAQGDKELKLLDIQNSQQNAAFMAQMAMQYFPAVEAARMQQICFLCCDLSGGLMQTVLHMPKGQGQPLADEFKMMLKAHLQNLA